MQTGLGWFSRSRSLSRQHRCRIYRRRGLLKIITQDSYDQAQATGLGPSIPSALLPWGHTFIKCYTIHELI